MNRLASFLFLIILLLGAFLRFYKLDSIPPSLNWDETAAAYNAYTIKNWAKDEWGKTLPLVFTSFRDDKRPIHIYITSMFFNLFGATDFSARFPSALIGFLMIPLFFLFGKLYFGSDLAGLFSAFAIAFSSYDIHYSRGLWEAHFALFFFVLGLVLFRAGLTRKGREALVPLAYFSFGLSLFSYHSALVVVPPMVFILTLFFLKDLLKILNSFSFGMFIFIFFISLLFFEPRLLGIARINQNKLPKETVEKTYIFQKTGNHLLGQLEIMIPKYKDYFSYQYLFEEGNKSPRASMNYGGKFSKTVFFLAIIGLIFLIAKGNFKIFLLILFWFLLAPLPAVFSSGEPHATRAIFMLGPPQILAGFGFFKIWQFLRASSLRFVLVLLILVFFAKDRALQILNYFDRYDKDYPIEWQYGMKHVVDIVRDSKYKKVYVDIVRQQPYIFFLWYNKVPLPEFLSTVKYDYSSSSSFNTVFSFDKYQFGGWDWVESAPLDNVAYVVEPYKYTGLRRRTDFLNVNLVKYPSGAEAFYVVSVY
ncbi:MAG: hypothetical protein KatS3mg088_438 [Patescibacteria group bacterium]|nr:MAG: hypothetical protein KatS3mg088_438 [Patescibacteria group bacterium]